MKRALVTSMLIGFVCLSVASCGPSPSGPRAGTPTPAARVTATAGRGTSEEWGVVKSKILPARYVRLSFSTGGAVAKVLVQEGSQVKAGDVLAELDTVDVALQVKAAQDALDLAKAELAQSKIPATPAEIAAAQAAYDSAVVALRQAQQGPTPEELEMLKSDLLKAQAALDLAQAKYDRVGGAKAPGIAMTQFSLDLQNASLDFQKAEANYAKALLSDPATLADAQSQVAQAQVTLQTKRAAPRPEDIAVAEVRVRQAETALEQKKVSLDKARLVAPIAGSVVGLALRAGETVQPNAIVVTLVDLSELRIETTELDEFGITGIQVGQPVNITVDALPGKVLQGRVLYVVSPELPLDPNGVSYVAGIALDAQEPALRYGMTARVDFGMR